MVGLTLSLAPYMMSAPPFTVATPVASAAG
jgi:hypothetical protein